MIADIAHGKIEFERAAREIRQEAAGRTCADCRFAIWGGSSGICVQHESVYGTQHIVRADHLQLYRRDAVGCRQWAVES